MPVSAPEPLGPYEQAALRRVLRELGQLSRFDAVARDFTVRGPVALEELDGKCGLDACELFDSACAFRNRHGLGQDEGVGLDSMQWCGATDH